MPFLRSLSQAPCNPPLFMGGKIMIIKHKGSTKKRIYERLIAEKDAISKAKAIGLDQSTIDLMISLYREEVVYFKEHYSENRG